MHPLPRAALLVVACLGAVSLLAGCHVSVSVGKHEVNKSEVEAQVATELAAKVNQPKPTVTCPGPLRAKVGASIDCQLVAQGDTATYPVHVVVDTVTNGKVHFTATVGDTPTGSVSTTA